MVGARACAIYVRACASIPKLPPILAILLTSACFVKEKSECALNAERIFMKFYNRYAPPPRVAAVIGGDSMTHQEYARECDINFIVARCASGLMPAPTPLEPVYTDVSDVPADYQECVNRILDAQDRFAALPARLRDRFGNDPAAMLAWMADKSNYDEGVKLGLFAAPPPPVDKPVDKPVEEATK